MKENIYRKARKNAAKKDPRLNSCDNSRETVYIERSRLLGIEKGTIIPNPDEVARMATAYEAPELCAHYCATACEIGKLMNYPLADYTNLSDIATPLMSALYFLEKANDSIFRILEDHKITEDERKEFAKILVTLEKVSDATDSLLLWAKKEGLYTDKPE